MVELQLTRSPEDKRRLDLPGVGSVRFQNRLGTALVISAPTRGEWRIERRGWVTPGNVAVDATGTEVAALCRDGVEHAGRLVRVSTPHTGPLERRPPFLIEEDGRGIARVAPRVWDEKPLDVTLLDEEFAAREPLLLLMALYAAQRVAATRQARAATGTGV